MGQFIHATALAGNVEILGGFHMKRGIHYRDVQKWPRRVSQGDGGDDKILGNRIRFFVPVFGLVD
jgi:hypothetical protein